MILVLKQGTSTDKVNEICSWLQKQFGVQTSPIFGSGTTIIGLVGDTSGISVETLELEEAVERVMKVQEPYKRSNRKFHPDNTLIRIGDAEIGGERLAIIAGPCSVESEEQIIQIARGVKDAGALFLRGGAFKPRTSPYAFQGLKAEEIGRAHV